MNVILLNKLSNFQIIYLLKICFEEDYTRHMIICYFQSGKKITIEI